MDLMVYIYMIFWITRLCFTDNSYSGMVEYHYYTKTLTWNEARVVCQDIGGDLAKLDSTEVLDNVTNLFISSFPQDDFKDIWIGLYEPEEGNRLWTTDCSQMTFTSFYIEAFKDDQRCFHLHVHDVAYLGERKKCSDKRKFMCERHTTEFCTMNETLRMDSVKKLVDLTAGDCTAACQGDGNCQSILYIPPTDCFLLANSTPSYIHPSPITLSTKDCLAVYFNTTDVTPPGDNNLYPDNTCIMSTASVMPLQTLTTSLSILLTSTVPLATSNPCVTYTSVMPSCDVTSSCDCLVSTVTQTQTVMTTFMTSYCDIMLSTIVISPSSTCPLTTPSTNYINITIHEAVKIADEISKNLTVSVKTTSAYIRSLTSAHDKRHSSTAMGIIGIVCVVIPILIILLIDARNIISARRNNQQM